MVNLIVVLLKGTSLHVDSTLNFKKKICTEMAEIERKLTLNISCDCSAFSKS